MSAPRSFQCPETGDKCADPHCTVELCCERERYKGVPAINNVMVPYRFSVVDVAVCNQRIVGYLVSVFDQIEKMQEKGA